MSVTRREIILGSASVVAAGSLLPTQSKATILQRSQIGTNGKRYRSLIRPRHPEFQSILEEHFPSIDQVPGISSFLPYLALVRNTSSRAVQAYTYWWKGTSTDGKEQLFSRMFYSSPTPRARHVFRSGRNDQLQPDEYALLSPMFLWSASRYARAQSKNRKLRVKRIPAELTTFLGATAGRSVQVALGCRISINKCLSWLADDSSTHLSTVRDSERATALQAISYLKNNPSTGPEVFASLLQNDQFLPATSGPAEAISASREFASAFARDVVIVGIDGVFTRLNQVAQSDPAAYTVIPAGRPSA